LLLPDRRIIGITYSKVQIGEFYMLKKSERSLREKIDRLFYSHTFSPMLHMFYLGKL